MPVNENVSASPGIGSYSYSEAGPTWPHAYLMPVVLPLIEKYARPGSRLFEIGAGNGSVAGVLAGRGFEVSGIEPSIEGVRIAYQSAPGARIWAGSVYDDLSAGHGQYDVVYAMEVLEHLYAPRELIAQARRLLRPGGALILSTPFHGYWKNLALALTGKLDAHFTALWDHGHIKFWSERTLRALIAEGGLKTEAFAFAGRRYPFSKSMIAVATVA